MTPGEADALPHLTDLRKLAAPLEPDNDARRRLTELAVAHVEAFLAQAPSAPTMVPGDHVADALAAYGVPDTPRDPAEVLDVVARLVETPGVATTSPRYLGYIPSGGLFHAALADFVAAATNRYAGLASVSPGAAGLETVVVRWLADAVGLGRDAGGVLASGGSAATLTAIVTARDTTGLLDAAGPVPVIYLGEHTHHSVDLALRVAGLARADVRRVPSDPCHRMDAEALAAAIREDRSHGRRPFLVVATAGTTSTGAVDPLAAIADVAGGEGLWFHIDAAYGGLFALCPEVAPVLRGLDRADSVVVDPHKTLFLPYGTGALLVRDRGLLQRVFSLSAEYLTPSLTTEPPSPADLGPELTRHFRALRVWLPLQLAGRRAFTAALSEKIILARHVHARLAEDPGFEVGPGPDLSIVTFRCASSGDLATAELAGALQHEGQIFVTTSRVASRLMIRIAVGSFRTHLADVDAAVDAVLRTSRRLGGHRSGTPARKTLAGAKASRDIDTKLRLEISAGRPNPDIAACELDVLGGRYGDTVADLDEAYGEYIDDTVWLSVRDPEGLVYGWARLIAPGSLPQKTLADASLPPWNLDGVQAADQIGLDPGSAWDVATIGVRRELGGAGSRVAAALYHGVLTGSSVNGAKWFLAMLDVRVRKLLDRVGLVMHTLPGATAQPYMGSPALIPVYTHIDSMLSGQQRYHPEAYQQITLGAGLDGIEIPSREGLLLRHITSVDLRETARTA
jgi:aromatic-L-amino-acid/L-tryptophan decarboxylase